MAMLAMRISVLCVKTFDEAIVSVARAQDLMSSGPVHVLDKQHVCIGVLVLQKRTCSCFSFTYAHRCFMSSGRVACGSPKKLLMAYAPAFEPLSKT